MGEYIARLCISQMARGIVESPHIVDRYLQQPFHQDAMRLFKLHRKVDGNDGMLGPFGVTKIHWGNCPNAGKVNSQKKMAI